MEYLRDRFERTDRSRTRRHLPVELSFNRDLSAYPCEDLVKKSKEQLLADDEIKFKEESSRFDGGGYYYYNGDFDWSDYDYSKRG